MFRISNVKLGTAIAAGALTLGAAGAYAAGNGSSVPLTGAAKTFTVNGLQLVSQNGTTLSSLPQFKNEGTCMSFWAKQKNLALQSSLISNGTKLPKNAHGKLVSFMTSWCKAHQAASTSSSASATSNADNQTAEPDSTGGSDSAKTETDHGHGIGHRHGHQGDNAN